MQRDLEEVRKRVEEALRMLEDVSKVFDSKPILRAIEELKIALMEINGVKRKSTEGLDHYRVKLKLVDELTKDGGSCYLESEGTGLSKIGYRPDAVIVKKDELVILEVETDQRRMVRKIRKLLDILPRIKSSPLATGRRLRVVFGVTGDVRDEIRDIAGSAGFEVYTVKEGRVLRVV